MLVDDQLARPLVEPGLDQSQRRRPPVLRLRGAPPHPGREHVVAVPVDRGARRAPARPPPPSPAGPQACGGGRPRSSVAGARANDYHGRCRTRSSHAGGRCWRFPAHAIRTRLTARPPSGGPRRAPCGGRPPPLGRWPMVSDTNRSRSRRPCRYRSMSIGKSRLGRQSPYQLGLSRPPRPKNSIIGMSMRICGSGTPTWTTVPARSRA